MFNIDVDSSYSSAVSNKVSFNALGFITALHLAIRNTADVKAIEIISFSSLLSM